MNRRMIIINYYDKKDIDKVLNKNYKRRIKKMINLILIFIFIIIAELIELRSRKMIRDYNRKLYEDIILELEEMRKTIEESTATIEEQ